MGVISFTDFNDCSLLVPRGHFWVSKRLWRGFYLVISKGGEISLATLLAQWGEAVQAGLSESWIAFLTESLLDAEVNIITKRYDIVCPALRCS